MSARTVELEAEVEHLRELKVVLEVRLGLTLKRAAEAERREVVCRRCEGLSQELTALQAVADRMGVERGELVARLKDCRDRALGDAFVEAHREEVGAIRVKRGRK